MNICYFGIYDPHYSRNRVLIKGLRSNGVEVVEIHEHGKGIIKYLRLLRRYVISRKDFDAMIVGFPGQGVMFLARLLTRKPIIFDAFTSHYGGYILDRKYYSPTSMRARYYRFMDTWSCRFADAVLLDTQAHIDFFVKEFGLPREKFRRIWAGADTNVFYPMRSRESHETFNVFFFGTFVPLQGIRYILEAAKLLEHEDLLFTVVGSGQDKPMALSLAENLGLRNVKFIGMLSLEDLAAEMAHADICLGIFGDSPKTMIVIPNKVYAAMAMKKPIITADTPAARELLSDSDMLMVPTADAHAIAQAILRLGSDEHLRNSLAESGYSLFMKKAQPSVLGQELKAIIEHL